MRMITFITVVLLMSPAFAGEEGSRTDTDVRVKRHLEAGIGYLNKGDNEAYTNLNMLEKAADEFREALRLAPDSAEAHYYLGVAFLVMDNRDGAVGEYHTLKELDAEMAEALHAKIKEYKAPAQYIKTGGGVVGGGGGGDRKKSGASCGRFAQKCHPGAPERLIN
jgi:tetratricopeptide (TPR) repeat protein